MSSQVAKLAAAGSFGIALLGLYFIFNSTSTQFRLRHVHRGYSFGRNVDAVR